MTLWPWVVVLTLLAVGWEFAGMANSIAPKPVYQTEVAGLLDYCSEIQASLEASQSAHQQAAGAAVSAYTMSSSLYSNYISGPSGSPAYMLQCWLNKPLSAGQTAAALASQASGNITVGTAVSTSLWTSAVQGQGLASQTMPYVLSASQVGTVVVLTGY